MFFILLQIIIRKIRYISTFLERRAIICSVFLLILLNTRLLAFLFGFEIVFISSTSAIHELFALIHSWIICVSFHNCSARTFIYGRLTICKKIRSSVKLHITRFLRKCLQCDLLNWIWRNFKEMSYLKISKANKY